MPGAVYGLVDPRTDCIRYIGQSRNAKARYRDHLYQARRRNCHRSCWIIGLAAKNLKPKLVILEETDRLDDAERFWISSLRAAGAELLNRTDGGC